MKTLAELKRKQAEELATFKKEKVIRSALHGLPGVVVSEAMICFHGTHVSIKLWNDFHTTKKLHEAVALVEHFKDQIVEGEHWKSGCVSTWPAEINSCIKDKGAVMDGSHAVEIEVRGGKGYGPNVIVSFWVRLANQLCEINCPVGDLYKLVPSVRGDYDKHGHFSGSITWPGERAVVDKFHTFWSKLPSFSGSYYLADVPNFMAWASNHVKPLLPEVA